MALLYLSIPVPCNSAGVSLQQIVTDRSQMLCFVTARSYVPRLSPGMNAFFELLHFVPNNVKPLVWLTSHFRMPAACAGKNPPELNKH
eukprot:6212734-Pleurochrysis_carterae.AAC.2